MLVTGSRVKVREPEQFIGDIARKLGGGRIGVVTGFTFPNSQPIVQFPAEGRKKVYCHGATRPEYLEEVPARFFRPISGFDDGRDHIEVVDGRSFAISFDLCSHMTRKDVTKHLPLSLLEAGATTRYWVELQQGPVRAMSHLEED